MKKKILASLLALCMIVAMIPVSAFAAVNDIDTVPGYAKSSVETWTGYGVVNGDDSGNFNPDDVMTRASYAQLIQNLMGYTKKATNTFSDVPAGAWYEDAILYMVEAGVMGGVGNGKMNPGGTITREQAAVMLGRALKITPNEEYAMTYGDVADISSWAKGYVAALTKAGWVSGVPGGNFAPQKDLTRAEGVAMLGKIVSVYVPASATAGVEIGDVKTFENKDGIVVVAGNVKVTFSAETTASVIVAPKSTGAEVEFTGDAVAPEVVVMGAGTSISGAGDVDKVEVTKEATGEISVTTPDTEVDATNSTVDVTIPNGTISAGDEGNTDDVAVVIAGLNPVDTTNEVTEMPTVTAEIDGATITLSTAEAVPEHTNADGNKGNWVGVAFKAPVNATGFKYAFGETGTLAASVLEDIGANINSDDPDFVKGATFWFDASKLSADKTEVIRLAWTYEGGTASDAVTYTIDMSDVKLPVAEYELSVQTLVAEAANSTAVTDIKSIRIGEGTEVTDSTKYNSMKVSAAAGDTVTIKVKCTRCIATCLMGSGVTESDKTQLQVTATQFTTDGDKTATYTIKVKMPASNAIVGIGVLSACENSNQSVTGLSACVANNDTMATELGNASEWNTYIAGEIGISD